MPFIRPTLSALRKMALQAFDTRLGTVVNPLRRRSLRISADVQAGMAHLELGYLDWQTRAVLMPDTAEDVYLERHARLYGITRLPASPAAGNAVFTGTRTDPIPLGALLQSADGSVQYATQSAVTLSGGTATVGIVATTGGAAGNAAGGAPLPLVVAIAGVNAVANADSAGLTGGLDVESYDSLRARTNARRTTPPQGGAALDYQAWARGVAGVTRVWVYPFPASGSVQVAFVMDGRSNILPLTGDVAAVQAAINAARPVTAACTVFALAASPLSVVISNLLPNTAAAQAAIVASLQAYVAAYATAASAVYGDGVSAANPGGKLWLSDIESAIDNTIGVQHFDLVSPSADFVASAGAIPTLGSVAFV